MTSLLTIEEVANYLQVTKKTVYRLREIDGMPAMKVGHQWRFDRNSIDVWLRKKSGVITIKILIIDDDETMCSLFKDTLEVVGYKVTTISDSIMGLELVKKENYDLVFLDLKMPVMDGSEIFRQIRESKPELPVTIITGYPDSDLMMRALAYGPLVVISKPFSSSDILTAVNNYLRFSMPTR